MLPQAEGTEGGAATPGLEEAREGPALPRPFRGTALPTPWPLEVGRETFLLAVSSGRLHQVPFALRLKTIEVYSPRVLQARNVTQASLGQSQGLGRAAFLSGGCG